MRSWQYAVLFALGSSTLAGLGLLSQLSKDADGGYAFSMPGVVFVAESCKWLISATLLLRQEGSLRNMLQIVHRVPLKSLLPFALPSVLYGLNNNLDMVCNLYMDSATFQVMMQMKVLSTGGLWRLVFGMPLGVRKWRALLLLALGGGCASLPSGGGPGTMAIQPIGIALMLVYCINSALASVATEYVYKRYCSQESIHLQNLAMYSFGMLANFVMYRASVIGHTPGVGLFGSLFHGYNFWTWVMVGNYISAGFLIGFVMKHLNNIHKLLMSGASMYVSAILTCVLFHLLPSRMYMIGLLVVTFALATYHWDEIARVWLHNTRRRRTLADLEICV